MKIIPASLELSSPEREVKALEKWKGGHSDPQSEKEHVEMTSTVLVTTECSD